MEPRPSTGYGVAWKPDSLSSTVLLETQLSTGDIVAWKPECLQGHVETRLSAGYRVAWKLSFLLDTGGHGILAIYWLHCCVET